MGQGLSCGEGHGSGILFNAIKAGNLEMVAALVRSDPSVVELTSGFDRVSALHVAAATGQIEILTMLLGQSVDPDISDRHKQTPLMLASMHGQLSCVQKLLASGANVLKFDSLHGRTCLHHAAFYGHSDCLKAILSAAHSTTVSDFWGFARFVNIRDGKGATALHLAARQSQPDCVSVLLDNGALVCSSTGRYGHRGNTPLHWAARAGSLECVRELLARGATRVQEDASGRIPYMIALKHKHRACAALLNPASAEPLVWPSSIKFIRELDPEARVLLKEALLEANREREKAILKGTDCSTVSPLHSEVEPEENTSEDGNTELCCICFDQICTIEVRECSHQMCAHCVIALCCHDDPNLIGTCPKAPICPFCRSSIKQLVVAKSNSKGDSDLEMSPSIHKPQRKSQNSSDGDEGFRSITAMGTFGIGSDTLGKKIAAECNEGVVKL